MTKLSDRILNVGTMLNMQNELNKIMHSVGWADNNCPDRLSVENYQTQILVESVELITESGVDFKWWKHTDASTFDKYNVNLEAIDILHFVLSMAWLTACDKDGTLDTTPFNDDFIGADVSQMNKANFPKLLDDNVLNQPAFVNNVTAFMCYRNLIPGQTPLEQAKMAITICANFVSSLDLETQYISALYRAKYELNKFRMSDGYKSGTYVKVKDGLEDNQRLKPIVEAFMDDSTKTLDWVAAEVRKKFFQSSL